MTVNIGLGRSYGRGPEEKRPTKITRHFLDNVPGSCPVSYTHLAGKKRSSSSRDGRSKTP